MNRDIEIDHNMRIRRPEWLFYAGSDWGNGDVERVVAVRFGPKETVVGIAQWPKIKDAGTEFSVELVVGSDFRRMIKQAKEPLPYFTKEALVQHWGRMITAAQEWPWK